MKLNDWDNLKLYSSFYLRDLFYFKNKFPFGNDRPFKLKCHGCMKRGCIKNTYVNVENMTININGQKVLFEKIENVPLMKCTNCGTEICDYRYEQFMDNLINNWKINNE